MKVKSMFLGLAVLGFVLGQVVFAEEPIGEYITITGRVTDSDGSIVSGAQIRAGGFMGNPENEQTIDNILYSSKTYTKGDGSYILNMKVGYEDSIKNPLKVILGVDVKKKGYERQFREIGDYTAGETKTIDFVMEKEGGEGSSADTGSDVDVTDSSGVTIVDDDERSEIPTNEAWIVGTVKDSNGPLAGVNVKAITIEGKNQYVVSKTTADENGSYKLIIPDYLFGVYGIGRAASLYAKVDYTGSVHPLPGLNGKVAYNQKIASVKPGHEITLDFTFPPADETWILMRFKQVQLCMRNDKWLGNAKVQIMLDGEEIHPFATKKVTKGESMKPKDGSVARYAHYTKDIVYQLKEKLCAFPHDIVVKVTYKEWDKDGMTERVRTKVKHLRIDIGKVYGPIEFNLGIWNKKMKLYI